MNKPIMKEYIVEYIDIDTPKTFRFNATDIQDLILAAERTIDIDTITSIKLVPNKPAIKRI